MKAKPLGDDLKEIDEAIRAAAHPAPEPVEDRSLGRLPGLGVIPMDVVDNGRG